MAVQLYVRQLYVVRRLYVAGWHIVAGQLQVAGWRIVNVGLHVAGRLHIVERLHMAGRYDSGRGSATTADVATQFWRAQGEDAIQVSTSTNIINT